MKPSNTGRLIADILPDTAAFQWRNERHRRCWSWYSIRLSTDSGLSASLRAGEARYGVISPRPPGNRRCLFMLDGTARST